MTQLPAPVSVHAITETSLTTDRVIELWLVHKSAATQDAYRRDVADFLDHCDQDLAQVRVTDILAWAETLTKRRLSASTVSRKLSSVKSLLTFSHRAGLVPVNAGAAVTMPRQAQGLSSRILTRAQILIILDAETEPRDRALLHVLYGAGSRISETLDLDWSDIRPAQERAHITFLGKGEKARTVLVPVFTVTALARLGPGLGPVFTTARGRLSRSQAYRVVRRAAARAGVQASPHWLRHAHASHALDAGAPVHVVQRQLGHTSLATTTAYVHARPKDSSSDYI